MTGDAASEAQQANDAALRAEFLTLMRQVPGAVAVIASAADGDAGGLVATAWSSLCADPPMLLACVNRSASAHDLILNTGAFGLSLLSSGDADVVGHFSGKGALSGKDRFVDGLWSSGACGQPLLAKAAVAFECSIETTHSYGTHTILIGRVGEMRRNPESAALLYLNGKFASAGPV